MILEVLEEEISEVIKGIKFEYDDAEHNIFIFEAVSGKKIFFYSVSNLITSDIVFSKIVQFDTLDEAEVEYDYYKGKINEE